MFGIIGDILSVGDALLEFKDFTKQDLINLTASGLTLWEISQRTGIALEILEETLTSS